MVEMEEMVVMELLVLLDHQDSMAGMVQLEVKVTKGILGHLDR